MDEADGSWLLAAFCALHGTGGRIFWVGSVEKVERERDQHNKKKSGRLTQTRRLVARLSEPGAVLALPIGGAQTVIIAGRVKARSAVRARIRMTQIRISLQQKENFQFREQSLVVRLHKRGHQPPSKGDPTLKHFPDNLTNWPLRIMRQDDHVLVIKRPRCGVN